VPDGLSRRDRGRILLTTDAVGGIWRYTLDLAHGLAERGMTPVIAVLGPAPDTSQRAEAAPFELIETGLALDWTAASPNELSATVASLRSLASGTGSAHLHAPALAGHEPWSLPVVAVAHSCTATWWRAVRGDALQSDFAWRMAATGAGLRAADAVIAPTRSHAEAVRAVYGAVPIAVVHNGAALPAPTTTARDRAVLAAGRLWDEGKNLAALDRIAPLLDAPIFAAGPVAGPNGATIALPHLHLRGALSQAEMRAEYARCRVFASPARYEPFGLSVLEAALAGMRLVLWEIPSFRELWDGAATFVADDDALLLALRHALDQPGDGGAQHRAQRYTLDAMVDRTLAVHRRFGARV